MKKLLLSAFATLCLCISLYAQTIRRVNNNAGVTGINVYTTIQAAHDAASSGDIIYVEPSITNYGDLISTKRLTFIGSGFLLNENQGSTGIYNTQISTIGYVTFKNGSANSKIVGLNTIIISILAPNITVDRCTFSGITMDFDYTATNVPPISIGNNAIITRCFSYDGVIVQSRDFAGTTYIPSNTYIANSVFRRNLDLKNATLTNCIINNELTMGATQFLINCTVNNNIFNGGNFGSSPTGAISNNYATTNFLPTGNGNVNNVNWNSIFIVSGPSIDKDYQLSPTGPVTNAGIFNGLNPYVLSGLPPYPITTNLTTSGSGNASTPLQVSITVRGNN